MPSTSPGGLFLGNPERRFYFDLARELGMSVKTLLATTTAYELTEWAAYWRIVNDEQERASKRARRKS